MCIRSKSFIVAGLIVSLFLAGFVSYYASGAPDGLTKVAIELGFMQAEQEHALIEGPLAGYATDGVDNARLSGGIAGVIGVLVTFAAAGGLFLAVRKRSRRGQSTGSE